MAVMETWQLTQTNLAHKLRNWFQQLVDIHSFLEGVNIKKKNETKGQMEDEAIIRKNYISNVYDE